MKTLPDYLAPDLDIVFVGINPGAHSAEVGHYFATPANRFWPAVNRSGLFPEPLTAEDDHRALEFGVGFTDVVKRPSSSASKLRAADYRDRRRQRHVDGSGYQAKRGSSAGHRHASRRPDFVTK